MRGFLSVSSTLVILISCLAGQNRSTTAKLSPETARNVHEIPTLDLGFTGDVSPVVGFLGSPAMSD